MPIMNWDASLDVGVDSMNREHQQILDAMNRIYDAQAQGKTGSAITALVDDLGRITTQHFIDEERFMEEIGFPSLSTHKVVHKKLLERFGEHAAKIKAANGVVEKEFFDFLRYWLSAHIKGVDAKYGEHAHAQNDRIAV